MARAATIDIAPVAQWFGALTALGVDRERLLEILSCSEETLEAKDGRIPIERHHAMIHEGAALAGSPGIVLRIGIQTRPENMGVVGHLMQHCETLLDAGRQIERYSRVLSETGHWTVESDGDMHDIWYDLADIDPVYPEVEQASLSSCMGMLRTLCGEPVQPLHARFTHADPGYADVYEQVFGLPVTFGAARCGLRITAGDAARPLPRRQSYLVDLLQQHADGLLARLASAGPVSTRTRELVLRHLPEGRVDIQWISDKLHMSRWTLTRHLKSEGTTFNGLVQQIRRELAHDYLGDPAMSVSEVGFLLGYSDPSAFQRAFRGWYACTPSDYRLRH